jgi:hypothetical protein
MYITVFYLSAAVIIKRSERIIMNGEVKESMKVD